MHLRRNVMKLHVHSFAYSVVYATLTAWLFAAALIAQPAYVAFAAERPNIIFILTDDQAPTAVSALGNRDLKTPHIDRLFREGAVLKNAFVTTPVCSPSRASLMTGRYASELGIYDWINPRVEAELGLNGAWPVWPKLLADAGYATGLVGKWHLGTADRYHPTRRGYQHFTGFRSGGARPFNPVFEIDGQDRKCDGYTYDLLTDYAIEFVRAHGDGPFALSLHFRAPHAPWLPAPEDDWAPHRDSDPEIPNPDYPKLDVAKIKRMTREYYASMAGVDRNVGRLLAELDRMKLVDNTIVVFTSDHGYNLGHNGVWYKGNAHWQLTEPPPKRWPHIPAQRRPNMYDQALRVPTVVRWPAAISPGTSIDRTVRNIDWFPTLLALAGVATPAGLEVRGSNFAPLLRGESIAWNDDLYAEYSMHHGAETHMRAWRTPQWKLMVDLRNPGRVELYDLQNDPAERTNLAASSDPKIQIVRRDLRARIDKQMRELGDIALQSQ